MKKPIFLTANDPLVESLHFQPYRSTEERRVERFLPEPDEPQTLEVATPWGAQLTAKKGDYLVSDPQHPTDRWPVDAEIFEGTYVIVRPGYGVKAAVTLLAPLTEVTGGDENQEVTVETLEGPETVRAGDFFLAKGIKGEIWPYPKEKQIHSLIKVE
jgi:hypothetical protein